MLTLTTKRPDYFEPEAGEPNECYSNVYLEVTHNLERVAVLGYIFKKGLPPMAHAWYVEKGTTVVDMSSALMIVLAFSRLVLTCPQAI